MKLSAQILHCAVFGCVASVFVFLALPSPAISASDANMPASKQLKPHQSGKNPFAKKIELNSETIQPGALVSVTVGLPADHEFTEGVPLQYEARLRKDADMKEFQKGKLTHPASELPLSFTLPKEEAAAGALEIVLQIAYCSLTPPKLCKFKTLTFVQPLMFDKTGKPSLDISGDVV